MSESENGRVVREIFEAFNRHDLDAVMNHLADDVTAIWPDGTRRDRKGIRKACAYLFEAFPDNRTRVDRMVSQGNTVVVEYIGVGTHKGEYLGIPATNKTYEMPIVWILDFEAGKVKLWKVYYLL